MSVFSKVDQYVIISIYSTAHIMAQKVDFLSEI